jgi:hypothetical protein
MAQPGRQVFDKSIRVIGITLRDKKRSNRPDLRIDRNERPNISDPPRAYQPCSRASVSCRQTKDLVHLALVQLSSLSSGARLLPAFSAAEMICESRLL